MFTTIRILIGDHVQKMQIMVFKEYVSVRLVHNQEDDCIHEILCNHHSTVVFHTLHVVLDNTFIMTCLEEDACVQIHYLLQLC